MTPNTIGSIAQPGATQNTIPRDAIIFIPGLSREVTGQTIEGVTLRLITAMDRNSAVAKNKLRLGEIRDEDYEHGSRTRVCTIFKKDADRDVPVIDLYGLLYRDKFIKRYDDMSLLMKILLIALTIVVMSFRIIGSFGNPAKTLKEKVQVVLSIFALSILVIYVVLLIIAGFDAIREALVANNILRVDVTNGTSGQAEPSFLGRWAQTIVIALTAIGIVLPTRLQIREFIVNSATTYTALVMYLQSGEQRNILVGQLRDLIEHIKSKDTDYTDLHIISYSFGSIIVLDALFPPDSKPGVRFGGINSITTIGSPFDFVRAFWPKYYDKRQSLPDSPRHWFNIFSPDDVLSSNFRDDGKTGPAKVSISSSTAGNDQGTNATTQTPADSIMKPPINIPFMRRMNQEELTWLDVVTFMGLRSHSMYWEKEDEPQINCFDQLVANVYKDHSLLQ